MSWACSSSQNLSLVLRLHFIRLNMQNYLMEAAAQLIPLYVHIGTYPLSSPVHRQLWLQMILDLDHVDQHDERIDSYHTSQLQHHADSATNQDISCPLPCSLSLYVSIPIPASQEMSASHLVSILKMTERALAWHYFYASQSHICL